jgi:hypothetical protein
LFFFQDATGGLSDASLDIENGLIHCSYTRAAVTEILTPTETPETVVVDLVSHNTKYFTIKYFILINIYFDIKRGLVVPKDVEIYSVAQGDTKNLTIPHHKLNSIFLSR